MISTITLAGSTLDLDAVEYQVVVDHGRNDVSDSPQASSAQIIYTQTGGTIIGAISDILTIDAYGVERFTGAVTDMDIVHTADTGGNPFTRTTILAMGTLSQLGYITVGAAGYAEESLESRVDNILTETGLAYTANTDPMMILLAEDPNAIDAASSLSALCLSTGATMADLPNGQILFESYSRRGYDYNPATWAYMPDTWADLSAITYDEAYTIGTAAPIPVTLPGNGVVWEPIWRNNVLTVVNDITVSYGDLAPQDTIQETDPTSIAVHGLRAAQLTTTLADPLDASTRAGNLITAQSVPRWDLQQIQVRVDLLEAVDQAAVLALVTGDRVLVEALPQPAPDTEYLGVVEGWSETYTPVGHTLVLSLSDPRYSYAMAEWVSVDPALAWSAASPSVQWYDVVLPDDLAA